MVALRALLVGEAAERPFVVLPSYTFIASANAVLWCGRRPLFVDVERHSWHVDPRALCDALERHGDRVGGILACSTFGVAPALDTAAQWESIARAHGVPLIVDSAPGFGALRSDGTLLGSQGDAEVFSFHATKPFAIGEGGAVTTRSGDLAERLRRLVNFGFDRGRAATETFGLNGKMSEIHAAIGLAVLDSFDAQLTARRQRANRLRPRLEAAGFGFQRGSEWSAWQFVPALAPDPAARAAVLRVSGARRVEIRNYHEPLHQCGRIASAGVCGDLAITEELGSRTLSLPLAVDMTAEECDHVVATVLGAVESSGD
jgi:dTDP-4-amino-4,6-dideoxygalactose transaminase